MDGREGMTLQGSASYYFNRGIGGSGGGNSVPHVHTNVHGGVVGDQGRVPISVFKTQSNQIQHQHPNLVGVSSGGAVGSTFDENPSNFSHGGGVMVHSGGETVKKKRGRPRKYGPDGANSNMSLGLSPMSASRPPSGEITPGEKSQVRKGRPPGSGWKQRLADVGGWMNSSAGLAFTPHILHVGIGEDVAAKIFAFAQQRQRALCILSANGSVSAITLRQPTTSGGTATYEGRFEILCLSGSYLLADSGAPGNWTGGISISFSSPDGQILGGAIGGRLIASNPVQVVMCSFVYGGGTKAKSKSESETKDGQMTVAPVNSMGSNQSPASNSGPSVWPSGLRGDAEIDLSR